MTDILVLIIGGIVSFAAVFFAGKSKGRSDAEADAAKEYGNKRKELDDADIGLGATDSERVERLHKIANGR